MTQKKETKASGLYSDLSGLVLRAVRRDTSTKPQINTVSQKTVPIFKIGNQKVGMKE